MRGAGRSYLVAPPGDGMGRGGRGLVAAGVGVVERKRGVVRVVKSSARVLERVRARHRECARGRAIGGGGSEQVNKVNKVIESQNDLIKFVRMFLNLKKNVCMSVA